MDDNDFRRLEQVLQRHFGTLSEDFQHKLDLVVEGHQVLDVKIDRLDARMGRLENRMGGLENRMDGLEGKVDGIAADLAAHRQDTEAHGGYRVCED